jgi:ABC-type proline/glycine betaine transport system ATPase subunit
LDKIDRTAIHTTIDERHEALTQTVGLLTHDIRQLGLELKQTNGIVHEMVKGHGMVAIASSHEQRISALEG